MAGSQANTGQWYEPETPYGKVKGKDLAPRNNASKSTIYPFNQVTETESGHIIELDDTPGAERINIHHRSGTFEEIHPNGDKVEKVVRDQYVSILRDSNVHIDGFSNVTVDKGLKVFVNRDNLPNAESSCVNFDIHVGQNANVNLFLEKGNCNVRLDDGDLNLEMKRGDINIAQDKGNFNHFIGGDYNLECTGHMHVVVGQDHVTEIGGSRDARVDGAFDNLQVTSGYKETLVGGDHRTEVMGGVYELYHKSQDTRILLNRIAHILGTNDTVIIATDTLNVGGSQNQTITGSRSVTTGGSTNILTGGSTKETTGGSLDMLSGGKTAISSSTMHLNGGSSIIGSGGVIHFNGPPASVASPATPASPSTSRPIYIPGQGGIWRKSSPTHSNSPLAQLQMVSMDLMGQLQIVNTLTTANAGIASQLGSLNENVAELSNLSGPLDQLGPAITENISGSLSIAQGITDQVAGVASGAADVASSAAGTATGAVGSITSAVGGTVGAAGGAVGAVGGAAGGIGGITDTISGGASSLGGLGTAFSGIGSVIGDVIGAIVDIGCAIGDLIKNFIGGVVNVINGVFSKISEILGKITGIIGEILGKIGEIIGGILGAINDVLGKIIDAAGKFIGGIASAINGILSNLFDGFGDIGCGEELLAGVAPDLGTDALPSVGGLG